MGPIKANRDIGRSGKDDKPTLLSAGPCSELPKEILRKGSLHLM